MTEFADRLKKYMDLAGLNQSDLARKTGITQSSISDWVLGKHTPNQRKIFTLAQALGVSPALLVADYDVPSNVIPLSKARRVPIVGDIACGSPILAEENLDGYFIADSSIKADFCLHAKGDSMIEAGIEDGDLVFLRQTPEVEDGRIAAVLIDHEATLKKVYRQKDQLILQPCNRKEAPIVLDAQTAEESGTSIIGECVGVYHAIKR